MAPQAILLTMAFLFAAAAEAGPREELLGRWRSDRSTTLAHLADHPTITPEQRKLLDNILGELVIEYTQESMTAQLDDWSETRAYDVVAQGADFVDLRSYDAAEQKMTTRRIWISGNRAWLWVEGIGFHEYFERIE